MKKALQLSRYENRGVNFSLNFLKTGASVIAVGTLIAGQSAYAQESQSEEPAQVDDQSGAQAEGNQIIVRGIRQSLENAQNIKRNADTVVDAITAEDIGALPDRSVTEALQRVPGVAINRFAGSNDPDHFSVEGSGVVVRGLNFVRSEFNGRTAFAAGIGGQALNFADVPAELLGSVIVSKNSTADMIEGGLAGTVNLNTRKPFDNDGFKIAFSAEANYGDFVEEWSPTFSGLISNTWDTEIGRFGLLASASYSRIRSRADGLQVTNFQTRDGQLVEEANTNGRLVCRNALPGSGDATTLPPGQSPCGTASTLGPDGFVDPADLRFAPLGGQFRTQEFDRKRNGLSLAAQFESVDGRTQITAEFIRSRTTNAWGEYTFEAAPDLAEYSTQPLGCQQNDAGPRRIQPDGSAGDPTVRSQCAVGGFTDYQYDSNNLFQSGYITNPNNGWRGNPGTSPFVPIGGLQNSLARRQVDEATTNNDYSIYMKSELTDRLTFEADLHYATSRKENLDVTIFGSSFADYELDITGRLPRITPNVPNFLSYSWAGDSDALAPFARDPSTPASADANAAYFSDPRFQFWRAAMDHIEDSTGEQFAWRADLAYEFDDDSFLREVKAGVRFQDREQTVRYTTYNWGVLSEVWAGDRPINFADTPASESAPFAFDNFFRGDSPPPPSTLYYSGDLTGDYAGLQNFALGVNQAWQGIGGNAGWVPLDQRPGAIDGTPYILPDIQPVSQRDDAAYISLRFGSDNFAGLRLAGNIGVRYVNTRFDSTGSIDLSVVRSSLQTDFDTLCDVTPPAGAPPGTIVTRPGICELGAASYANLQDFANSDPGFNVARNNYDYWLPSFNARAELSDDLLLRLAASRVLTRPDNSLLRNFVNVGVDLGTGVLSAGAGNPFLLPATAWQFDVSLEWYFAPVGQLTVNGFYKAIDNFFFNDVSVRDITSGNQTNQVVVRGPANFDGTGKIKGFEVAYQQTYDFLPAPFDGLGVAANYTFIDSSGLPNSFLNGGASSTIAPSGNLPLEQLSKHNANATVFYEKGPVALRAAYNWRSRFLLTTSDVIFPFFSIFNEPTGQLDASIFVNVTDNIRLGVQGVNLLNEVTETTQAYTGDPNVLAPRSFFINDRRFSFILRGNF